MNTESLCKYEWVDECVQETLLQSYLMYVDGDNICRWIWWLGAQCNADDKHEYIESLSH